MNAMVDTMESFSVNRKKIDWVSFRSQVLAALPADATINQTSPAILLALRLLGDNHSVYTSANLGVLSAYSLNCAATKISGTPALDADIGYVRVTNFDPPPGSPAAQAFTDALQATIRATDSPQIRGWIVDLRGNTGGDMWPMVAGLGPILGSGVAGYFVDPDGVATQWDYDGYESEVNGAMQQHVSSPYTLISPSPRVAVLIDQLVASSGEATAVSFKQRPNTQFFGTPTCGLATANKAHTMSDGAILTLTGATDADRKSTLYGGPLQPDVLISDTSAVIPAAVAWLRSSHP